MCLRREYGEVSVMMCAFVSRMCREDGEVSVIMCICVG